jgi:hypothetical protein
MLSSLRLAFFNPLFGGDGGSSPGTGGLGGMFLGFGETV